MENKVANKVDNKTERFRRIYSNIPLGVRREIVIVLDGKPISWDVAFIEINNKTKLGNVILEKLDELQII